MEDSREMTVAVPLFVAGDRRAHDGAAPPTDARLCGSFVKRRARGERDGRGRGPSGGRAWRDRRRAARAIALVVLTMGAAAGVRALRQPSGPVVRVVSIDQTMGPIAIDQRTGRAFVLTWGGGAAHVTTLDTRAGALVRTVAVGSDPGGGSGALGVDRDTGHVFAAVDGGGATVASVTMLDASGSDTLARVAIPPGPQAVTVDERARRVIVSGMGATTRGRPVDTVSTLDTRTGRLLRIARTAAGDDHRAIVDDGRAHRRLVFTWRDSTPRSRIDVVATGTGRVVARTRGPLSPWTVAVDAATHRAFALTGRDVAVYDTRSGRLVRRVPVATGAGALEVDERT